MTANVAASADWWALTIYVAVALMCAVLIWRMH